MPNYHKVPSELHWRNMWLPSFNIKSEHQPTFLEVRSRGWGLAFLVSCCHCFFVAISMCATAYHDCWVRNYQAAHFGVITEKFSSVRHEEAVGLGDPDWSPPYPQGIACIVHGAAGKEGWHGHQESCPWESPSLLWASVSSSLKWQSRVSRSLKAPWLCLSQILYSVEQKVHDAFKSTKNL